MPSLFVFRRLPLAMLVSVVAHLGLLVMAQR